MLALTTALLRNFVLCIMSHVFVHKICNTYTAF